MIEPAIYGAFNARWLSFEDVAKTFVPIPQFLQLGHESHSVLLGPRGCGKTTLLKMLTRRALDGWETSLRAGRFDTSFSRPRYEAVYISSDVRWSYELNSIAEDSGLSKVQSIQAQRVMVSINSIISVLEVAQGLTRESNQDSEIASSMISHWRLTNTLRSIVDVKATLAAIASEIRGLLNLGNVVGLEDAFRRLPPSFYGHPLDAPFEVLGIVGDLLPAGAQPKSWALCYDELEIAPKWLRTELLESLRSSKQNVFLKLTWSPLLPSGLRTSPESAADFKAIRLWHSHVGDPRAFCEELTQDFLRERFPGARLTPEQFFSRSILAAEAGDEPSGSYEHGSTEYEVFRELAGWDQSFRKLMKEREINPDDPIPKSAVQKDQFFRKVKPIALLRLEFMAERGGRTRKRPAIYAGKEAVYAMSEGNPRWLRGLLNDFADLSGVASGRGDGSIRVPYRDQAKLLNTAGQRFLALIKASPFKPPVGDSKGHSEDDATLYGFITEVGRFFNEQIYSVDFPLDPIGSFSVPQDADAGSLAIIEQLLELGGVVYIGSSPQDVPIAVPGSRFRLSFILAPIHKIALRTYREIPLTEISSRRQERGQLRLEF